MNLSTKRITSADADSLASGSQIPVYQKPGFSSQIINRKTFALVGGAIIILAQLLFILRSIYLIVGLAMCLGLAGFTTYLTTPNVKPHLEDED